MRSLAVLALALLLAAPAVDAQSLPRRGTARVALPVDVVDVVYNRDKDVTVWATVEMECDTGANGPNFSLFFDESGHSDPHWWTIRAYQMQGSSEQQGNTWRVNRTYTYTIQGDAEVHENSSVTLSWRIRGEDTSGISVPPRCSNTGTAYDLVETKNLTLRMRAVPREPEPPEPNFNVVARPQDEQVESAPTFGGTSRIPVEAAFTMTAGIALAAFVLMRAMGRR